MLLKCQHRGQGRCKGPQPEHSLGLSDSPTAPERRLVRESLLARAESLRRNLLASTSDVNITDKADVRDHSQNIPWDTVRVLSRPERWPSLAAGWGPNVNKGVRLRASPSPLNVGTTFPDSSPVKRPVDQCLHPEDSEGVSCRGH